MSDSNATNTSRNVMLAGGGAALVGLGLAAGMLLRSPAPQADKAAADAPVAVASGALPASAAAQAITASTPGATAQTEAPKAESAKAAHRHEPREASRHHPATETAQGGQPIQQAQPAAQVCATCGTVDSVRAVQQKGEGSGVGAVAGGVLGGVVGNQIGKGSGKTAMTVLGAIGGGLAGNEIEKRQRAETVYEVTVRMDDGSYRTLTQHTAPATGSRVEVDGQTLRPLNR